MLPSGRAPARSCSGPCAGTCEQCVSLRPLLTRRCDGAEGAVERLDPGELVVFGRDSLCGSGFRGWCGHSVQAAMVRAVGRAAARPGARAGLFIRRGPSDPRCGAGCARRQPTPVTSGVWAFGSRIGCPPGNAWDDGPPARPARRPASGLWRRCRSGSGSGRESRMPRSRTGMCRPDGPTPKHSPTPVIRSRTP